VILVVAPATAVVRSALAIVRIDGPASGDIILRLGGVIPEERVATLTQLRHNGVLLDECVAVRYAAPRSFTGNDLVELTLHGSPLIVDRLSHTSYRRAVFASSRGRAGLYSKFSLRSPIARAT